MKGLYVTSDEQHMDNFINIDHAKPNSSSNLFYKGILSGKSKAVFGGTVLVRKEAQKTREIGDESMTKYKRVVKHIEAAFIRVMESE